MSFIKELRSYFFRRNAPINPNVPGDRKDNMATEGVPSQDTIERFTASHLNFKERGDRAKQSTGSEPDEELVGHVQVATDEEVTNYDDGLVNTAGSETTKVVHPQQLTEAAEDPNTISLNAVDGDTSTNGGANIQSIEITKDATETRRNKFLFRFAQDFIDYFNSIVANISTINETIYGPGGVDNPGGGLTDTSGLKVEEEGNEISGSNDPIGVMNFVGTLVEATYPAANRAEINFQGVEDAIEDVGSGDTGVVNDTWNTILNPKGSVAGAYTATLRRTDGSPSTSTKNLDTTNSFEFIYSKKVGKMLYLYFDVVHYYNITAFVAEPVSLFLPIGNVADLAGKYETDDAGDDGASLLPEPIEFSFESLSELNLRSDFFNINNPGNLTKCSLTKVVGGAAYDHIESGTTRAIFGNGKLFLGMKASFVIPLV